MVMRNRVVIRTPKRRKVWAHFNDSIVLGSGTSSPKVNDMLEDYFADQGAGQQGGLTVMRIVGKITAENHTQGATTDVTENVRLGIIWLDSQLAAASDGDSQIPEPAQNGAREGNWIQQWVATVTEQSSASVQQNAPCQPQLEGVSYFPYVDVRQQRKQPNAAAKLCFVTSGGSGFESNTVRIQPELDVLLALP